MFCSLQFSGFLSLVFGRLLGLLEQRIGPRQCLVTVKDKKNNEKIALPFHAASKFGFKIHVLERKKTVYGLDRTANTMLTLVKLQIYNLVFYVTSVD
jgi:hypothetical protein